MCSQGREQEGDLLQIQNKPQPSPPPPSKSLDPNARGPRAQLQDKQLFMGGEGGTDGNDTPTMCPALEQSPQ